MEKSVKDTAGEPMTGRSFARNTVYNLIGQGAPLLVAVFAIPILLKGLGTDRFGILTLSWMFIGYFSIFDLGLGRALTQLVAERIGTEREGDVPTLFWTAHTIMLMLGTVGAIIAGAISSPLVHSVLKVPPQIIDEAVYSFYILSALIPVVILTAGFRGVLEAYHHFGLINAVRVPMGVFTFGGPLIVLPWSNHLGPAIFSLAVVRVCVMYAYYRCCMKVLPSLSERITIEKDYVRPLLGFGGWMTVSNVISPIMVSMDRFVIGAVLSTTAVAYYATPYELVTKLLIIPSALVCILFPAFATTYQTNPEKALHYYSRSIKCIFLILLPFVLAFVIFAREGLSLWVGSEFALHSFRVLQWLAIGVLINSVALVPFSFVQGIGRPDLTSKLHLLELPLYLVILGVLLKEKGIVGAAVAWSVRVTIDGVALLLIVNKIGQTRSALKFTAFMAIFIVLLFLGFNLSNIVYKLLFFSGYMFTAISVALYSFLGERRSKLLETRCLSR